VHALPEIAASYTDAEARRATAEALGRVAGDWLTDDDREDVTACVARAGLAAFLEWRSDPVGAWRHAVVRAVRVAAGEFVTQLRRQREHEIRETASGVAPDHLVDDDEVIGWCYERATWAARQLVAKGKLPSSAIDDAIQATVIAALGAMERWDPAQAPWKWWLQRRIGGEIHDQAERARQYTHTSRDAMGSRELAALDSDDASTTADLPGRLDAAALLSGIARYSREHLTPAQQAAYSVLCRDEAATAAPSTDGEAPCPTTQAAGRTARYEALTRIRGAFVDDYSTYRAA